MDARPYTPSSEYMTAKQFARELGVGIELVQGLVGDKKIAGTETVSSNNNRVFMVERSELPRVKALLGL